MPLRGASPVAPQEPKAAWAEREAPRTSGSSVSKEKLRPHGKATATELSAGTRLALLDGAPTRMVAQTTSKLTIGKKLPATSIVHWHGLSWRRRAALVFRPSTVMLGKVLRAALPGMITASLAAVVFSFVLVTKQGRSLLGGALLYGRWTFEELSCEDWMAETHCFDGSLSDDAAEGKSPFMSPLGQLIDMKVLNITFAVAHVATTCYCSGAASLTFRGRVRSVYWILTACVVQFVIALGLVLHWHFAADDIHYDGTVLLLFPVAGLLGLTTLINRYGCDPPRRPLALPYELLWYYESGAVSTVAAITLSLCIWVLPAAGAGPLGTVAVSVTFAKLANAAALHACLHFTHATSAHLLVTVFGIDLALKFVIRNFIASFSAGIVLQASILLFVLESMLCLVKWYAFRSCWEKGSSREQAHRHSMRTIDLIAQGLAEILSSWTIFPARVMTDPRLYSVFGNVACDVSGHLGVEIAKFATQVLFALAGAWLLFFGESISHSSHAFDFPCKPLFERGMTVYVASIAIYTVSLSVGPQLRIGCFYCHAGDHDQCAP